LPNSTRGIRGLGNSYFFQKKFDDAIAEYRKGWSLGDVDCLRQAAATYVALYRFEDMEDLIPSLVKHKEEDTEIVEALLAYSIRKKLPNQKLFEEITSSLTDDVILSRDQTTEIVIEGLTLFKDEKRLARIKAKLKSKSQTP
jgi:hypothetical protein